MNKKRTDEFAESKRTRDARLAEFDTGAKLLRELEDERTLAAETYAIDMTEDGLARVEDLELRIRRKRIEVEALQSRFFDADRVYEKHAAAAKRVQLNEMVKRADPDLARREIYEMLAPFALEFRTQFATRLDRARERADAQRQAACDVRVLASEIGEDRELDHVRVDDVRILTSVAIGDLGGETDAAPVHLFLTPVRGPWVYVDGQKQTNPLCAPEDWDFARRFLDAQKTEA